MTQRERQVDLVKSKGLRQLDFWCHLLIRPFTPTNQRRRKAVALILSVATGSMALELSFLLSRNELPRVVPSRRFRTGLLLRVTIQMPAQQFPSVAGGLIPVLYLSSLSRDEQGPGIAIRLVSVLVVAFCRWPNSCTGWVRGLLSWVRPRKCLVHCQQGSNS